MTDELDDYIKAASNSPETASREKLERARVRARLLGHEIPDDVTEDFHNAVMMESGRSHVWTTGKRKGKVKESPRDPKDGQVAVGFSQIKPGTIKNWGNDLDPYNEDDNIAGGLLEFYNGDKSDPVARRISYFAGPNSGALKEYRRTGRIPNGGDFTGTSFGKYMEGTGAYKNVDDYIKKGGNDTPNDTKATIQNDLDDYIKSAANDVSENSPLSEAFPNGSPVQSEKPYAGTIDDLQREKKPFVEKTPFTIPQAPPSPTFPNPVINAEKGQAENLSDQKLAPPPPLSPKFSGQLPSPPPLSPKLGGKLLAPPPLSDAQTASRKTPSPGEVLIGSVLGEPPPLAEKQTGAQKLKFENGAVESDDQKDVPVGKKRVVTPEGKKFIVQAQAEGKYNFEEEQERPAATDADYEQYVKEFPNFAQAGEKQMSREEFFKAANENASGGTTSVGYQKELLTDEAKAEREKYEQESADYNLKIEEHNRRTKEYNAAIEKLKGEYAGNLKGLSEAENQRLTAEFERFIKGETEEVILKNSGKDAPGLSIVKDKNSLTGGDQTQKNINQGLAASFAYKVTAPTGRKLTPREAIDTAFSALPSDVQKADAALRQATGTSLFQDTPEYLDFIQRNIDNYGATSIKHNLDFQQQAVVDAYKQNGYEGVRALMEKSKGAFDKFASSGFTDTGTLSGANSDLDAATRSSFIESRSPTELDTTQEEKESAEKRAREKTLSELADGSDFDKAVYYGGKVVEQIGKGNPLPFAGANREYSDEERIGRETERIENLFGSYEIYQKFKQDRDRMGYIELGIRTAGQFGSNISKAILDIPKTILTFDKFFADYGPTNWLGEKLGVKRHGGGLQELGNLFEKGFAALEGREADIEKADMPLDQQRLFQMVNWMQDQYIEDKGVQVYRGEQMANQTASSAAMFLLGGWATKGSKAGIALLGIGAGVGPMYEEAKKKGATEADAVFWSVITGTPLRATEIVGIGGQASRMFKLAKLGSELSEGSVKILAKGLADYALAAAKAGGKGLIEEVGQEGLQQTIQGATIRAITAQNPKDGSKVAEFFAALPGEAGKSVEGAAYGGGMGLLLGGGGSIIQTRASRTKQANSSYSNGYLLDPTSKTRVKLSPEEKAEYTSIRKQLNKNISRQADTSKIKAEDRQKKKSVLPNNVNLLREQKDHDSTIQQETKALFEKEAEFLRRVFTPERIEEIEDKSAQSAQSKQKTLKERLANFIHPEGKQKLENETERRETAERELNIDPVLKIANRRALDLALPAAEADAGTSIISFDGNNFGKVNKILNEIEGDKVFKGAADALREAASENGIADRVFRKGGDEFVIIAPNRIALKVQKRAEELFGEETFSNAKGESTIVSLSGTIGNTFEEANDLLQEAKKIRKGEKAAQTGQEFAKNAPPMPVFLRRATAEEDLTGLQVQIAGGETGTAIKQISPNNIAVEIASDGKKRVVQTRRRALQVIAHSPADVQLQNFVEQILKEDATPAAESADSDIKYGRYQEKEKTRKSATKSTVKKIYSADNPEIISQSDIAKFDFDAPRNASITQPSNKESEQTPDIQPKSADKSRLLSNKKIEKPLGASSDKKSEKDDILSSSETKEDNSPEVETEKSERKPPRRSRLQEPHTVQVDKETLKFAKRNKGRISNRLYKIETVGDKIKILSAPSNVSAENLQADLERVVIEAEGERISLRAPYKKPSYDTKKHSLFAFVHYSGGIAPSKSYDTAKLGGVKWGIQPIVRAGGVSAERLLSSAGEAGYLTGIAGGYDTSAAFDRNAFTVNNFLDAVAEDHSRPTHFALDYYEENALSIEEAEAEYYRQKEEKLKAERELAGLPAEIIKTAKTIADFYEHSDVAEILNIVAEQGNITDEQRSELFQIGHYELELEQDETRNAIQNAIEAIESRQREIQAIPEGASDADTSGNSGSNSGSQTNPLYQEEIESFDETEPEGDVDMSFDFGANEESQKPTRKLEDYYKPEQQSLIGADMEEGLFAQGGAKPLDLFAGTPQKAESKKDRQTEFARNQLEKAVGEKFADYLTEPHSPIAKTKDVIKGDALKNPAFYKDKDADALFEPLSVFSRLKINKQEVSEYLTQAGLFGGKFEELNDARKELLQKLEDSYDNAEETIEAVREFLDNNALSEASIESKEEIEKANPSQKIEDFGEKIGGARKDLAQKLSEITGDDIKTKPLSKSFPRPDFAQLVADALITKEGAKFLNFLYDNIPPKPRKSYRLAGWVKTVESAINTFKDLIESNTTKNIDFTESLLKTTTNLNLKKNYEIYSKILDVFGFPENNVNLGGYEIRKFDHTRRGKDEEFGTLYTIVKGNFIIKDFETLDDAAKGLKSLLESNKEAVKDVKFDLYEDRKTKEFFIGKKRATGVVRLMEGFKTAKEGRSFLTDKQTELETLWNALKVNPNERRKENRERIGNNWRKGENISPEKFAETFGFRGIEFGNWVNNSERQNSINEAYDALMDMAGVLNISPKAISLNGELGIGFGSRGGGKASAHYEPDKIVINLTKTKGAGSLGHEWWHALDNYFSRMRGNAEGYLTNNPRQRRTKFGDYDQSVRVEMIDAYKGVMDAIGSSGLQTRSNQLDRTRTKLYWSTPIEMSARSFENFLIEKLAESNEQNDYLANFKEVGLWINENGLDLDNYPYPLKDESENINNAFTNFFEIIQEEETESGTALKSVADNTSAVAKQKALEEMSAFFIRTAPLEAQIKSGDKSEVRRAAKEIYQNFRALTAQTTDGREVRFTNTGFKETLNHSADVRVLQIIPELPNLIERAIPLWSEPISREGKPNLKAFHNYAIKIKIGDETAFARITVREDNDGHLYYDNHVISAAKLLKAQPTQPDRHTIAGEELATLSKDRLFQWWHSVKATDDGSQPLKRVRDAESADLLTDILPKAHTEDVLTGMDSLLRGDDLHLTPHDAEFLRRAFGEIYYRKNKKEQAESAFDGILFKPTQFDEILPLLRESVNKLKKLGYSDIQLKGLEKLIRNLYEIAGRNRGTGALFVFDDALAEEKFHQEDYLAGTTDATARRQIQESEFWQIAQTGKFAKDYGSLSVNDKISEVVAKLATDNARRYGFDKVTDFEQKKNELLEVWADGVLRRNKIDTREKFDTFIKEFKRIGKYAKFKESNRGRSRADTAGTERTRSDGESSAGESRSAGNRDDGQTATAARSGEPSDLRPAEKQSEREITEEANAVGVTPAEIRYKNRQFAATLRENGREADDVPYIPESEAGWIDEAKEILRQSRVYADAQGVPDYQYAIQQFNSPDIVHSTRTALGIALIDHLGAIGENKQMLAIAGATTVHVGSAAQALRASQLVSKYDFAKGIELAQKALSKDGKTLSDKQIDELKDLTDKYASSERERAFYEQAFADAKTAIENLKAENKEISESLGEIGEEFDDNRRQLSNLKRQLERWKNKVLGNSTAGLRTAKRHKELKDKKSAILERLKTAFPNKEMALKSVVRFDQWNYSKNFENNQLKNQNNNPFNRNWINEDASILKSVADSTFDDATREALTEYAALSIFEGTSYEDLINNLDDITTGVLNADEIRQIHSDAELMTRGERAGKSPEVIEKLKVRNEHRNRAGEFRKEKTGADLNRLERETLVLAKDDETGKAAVILNRAKSKDDWFKTAKSEFKGKPEKELNQLFRDAFNLKAEAKASLVKQRLENVREISLTEKEVDQIEFEKRVRASNSTQNKRTLDRFYKELEKNKAQKAADIFMEVINITKGLRATGEISYIFRQGALPLILDTRAAVRADIQGAFHGLADSVEKIQVFVEKIREHPRLQESQAMGARFTELGDVKFADEHFSSKLLEKIPLYRRAEMAYTLPGDLQRLYVYDIWAKVIEDQTDLSKQETIKAKRYAMETINALTGKGDIKKVLSSGGAFSKLANILLFSPSLLVSRFQSAYRLSGIPIGISAVSGGAFGTPKGLKMQMAKKSLRFYSAIALLGFLAGMILDPDDDDFGKIKPRKDGLMSKILGDDVRDMKIDVMAGMDAPTQLIWRTVGGFVKAVGNNDREHFIDAMTENSRKFTTSKSGDWRFLRGKLAPTASEAFSWYKGTDFIGRPVTAWNSFTNLTVPMSWGQVYDAALYDRKSAMMNDAPEFAKIGERASREKKTRNAVGVMLFTFLGIGVGQYPKDESSAATQKAQELSDFISNKTSEERRIEGGLRKLFTYQNELIKEGKDKSEAERFISRIAKQYNVKSADLASIEKQAKEQHGLLKFYASGLGDSEFERVMMKATPEEREVLERAKEKRAENKAKKETSETKPLSEKLKRASTDKAVELYSEFESKLSDAQKKHFLRSLRQKTLSANNRGTLTAEEYERVKKVLPELNIKLKKPRKPKKAKASVLDSVN